MRRVLVLILLFAASLTTAIAQEPASSGRPWWWDDAFWQRGEIAATASHPVETRWVSYKSGNTDIPALVARPKDGKKYPGILFMHGRRGLDELVQLQVMRLAARGFVVLAPDVYQAHFIPAMPIEHDYRLEADADRGIDALLGLPDLASRRICLASHTRGGYFTLKMAVTLKRQEREIACYVSWYPHWQDPNAPEPLQVYGYAKEADELKIPTLVFVGEQEQYQRRRVIEEAVKNMERAGRPVRLVVYPGVGRGFDFRPAGVRTFADDLASKDSLARAAEFFRQHLEK
ncbi:MAG TPA: dienelactone hydrolase family protein [Burkholderiales bacterium]|nr:dienelactone hydrolase family protein [Burkholderiales bacterium]